MPTAHGPRPCPTASPALPTPASPTTEWSPTLSEVSMAQPPTAAAPTTAPSTSSPRKCVPGSGNLGVRDRDYCFCTTLELIAPASVAIWNTVWPLLTSTKFVCDVLPPATEVVVPVQSELIV